jgi:RNA polymerase sigma factor (TIGR02999 family)
LVYAELRALAASFLRDRPAHTLQPTALVHEAYLKLGRSDRASRGGCVDQEHFMALAATAMRQVLVDHARRRLRIKRGGGARTLIDVSTVMDSATASRRAYQTLELDELLLTLATADQRAARVAEMRLFGGMTQEQIANVLCVSRMTVVSDWAFARAWLAAKADVGEDGQAPRGR